MSKVAATACMVFMLHADAFASTSSPECGSDSTNASGDPQSVSTSFSAGSLVIPMDSNCYNPDSAGTNGNPKDSAGSCSTGAETGYVCYGGTSSGNVRLPFGVLYLLAENNIPVSIILKNTKTSLAEADFSITPPSGSSTTVPTVSHLTESSTGYATDSVLSPSLANNTVYYGGMPFVVDAAFAQQALQVLTTFNNANSDLFKAVNIHVANYGFTAPVLAVMASRPKPVLIDQAPLDGFFSESGITSVAASGTTYLTLSGSGTSYSFTWPVSAFGSSPAGCSSAGVCTSPLDTSNNRIVDIIWSSNNLGNVNNWSSMGTFFQKAGTVLAVDAGVSWESGSGGTFGGGLSVTSKGAQKSDFCAGVAVKSASGDLSVPGPATEYPASNRFLQTGDIDLTFQGNGGGADGASSWDFSSTPASYTEGLSDGSGYGAIAGHPKVSGTQTTGNLIYLADLHSWDGKAANKDGGLHIMYNTLVAGGDGGTTNCTAAELTRSSSVALSITQSDGTSNYDEFLGSFDWNVPASGTSMGQTLFQANPADYPYMTGHFREYKPVGTYTGSITNTPTCSSTSASSPCNWDAATKLKPFSQRNIFVGTGTFGSYTLKTASSMTATDNTIKYISGKLDNKDSSGNSTSGILGGIDWSTAAVIDSRNVGGFTNRPTIAYVGARDGMLHAFCVAPASGATDCYGFAAGEEIWAIIPPGMKAKMDTAYNGGTNMDWSTVNVGGAIRVADLADKFAGSSTAITRTILIVGMHDSGYVDAFDISDPNPANFNSDGFRLLWENDGTHVATGVTSMTMGPTNGATIAQVSQSSSTGVAVVTSATCYGQSGCASTVKQGYNTYVIRLSDGLIVSDEQNTYSLKEAPLGTTPIPNDVPPLPTSLDVDGDGTDETVYVATLEGKIRQYTLTSQGVTAPTLAVISGGAGLDVYNANSLTAAACGTNACQPIGVSPTIVRSSNGTDFYVLVATGGADWARQTTDKSDLTATTHQSYVTGFVAKTPATTAVTQYPTSPFKLGGIQPPASAAGGSSPGTSTLVPLSLRAYAQLTVAGTDLYANVTSISIGNMSQLLQPLVTPGTYGNVERWLGINSTSPTSYGSILTSGTAYAGGAGSVLETNVNGATSGGEIFVAGATSSIRQSLTSSSTSYSNSSYGVSKSTAGYRPFTTSAWFDLSN